MTANELAKILKITSEILSCFGDVPLEEALNDLKRKSKSGVPSKKNKKYSESYSNIQIQEIVSSGTDEVLMKLSDPVFQSRDNLIKLAQALSIQVSTRNNVETIIHTIQKHFERQKMDTILSNERNTESKIKEGE